MKKLAIIFFALALFMSPGLFAQMPTWNLSGALQRSFTQGADKVWYFMESDSLVHDPAGYRLLTQYLFPCGFTEVGCWRGVEDHPSVCPSCVERTGIGFNFTNRLLVSNCDYCGLPEYRPHRAVLLPTSERFAIVAWQSPVTGAVKVSARFRQSNQCCIAQSADWSVDKGNQTLRSGHIGFGHDADPVSISNLKVAKDDVLYFVVASFWGFTGAVLPLDLQVTITQVQ